MESVGIGLLAGVLFGLLTVLVRRGVMRVPDPIAGSVVILGMAGSILLVATVALGQAGDLPDWRTGLLYLAVGAFAPGLSQIVFMFAVRDAGASRVAIMIGMAPLLSTAIAILFRGEPFKAGLAAGTVLIVLGGVSLAWDRNLPPGFRRRGMLLGFACALLFAVRDNLVRMIDSSSDMHATAGTAWTLIGAFLAVAVFAAAMKRGELPAQMRRCVRPYLPAGIVFAMAYFTLVLALEIGRVTIFAPLNAMQSMWTVVFAWFLLGKSDAIGLRIVVAMALVVSGGILIGVFR
jgi:drug/metabolite transporter (DMT)-like permease